MRKNKVLYQKDGKSTPVPIKIPTITPNIESAEDIIPTIKVLTNKDGSAASATTVLLPEIPTAIPPIKFVTPTAMPPQK